MNATATYAYSSNSIYESLTDYAQRAYQSVAEAVSRAHQRRVTIGQLEALNDRQLRDIGIDRNDIRQYVHAAV